MYLGTGIMYSSHPSKAPEDIIELMTQVHNKFPTIPQYIFGTYPKPGTLEKYVSEEEWRIVLE